MNSAFRLLFILLTVNGFSIIASFGQELNLSPPDSVQKPTKKNTKQRARPNAPDVAPLYSPSFNDFTTRIFDPNIQTLIVHHSSSELEMPVIVLRSNEKAVVRFDDLSPIPRDFGYSFEHCTYDWRSSELQTMDFQTGFNSDVINDYDFSFNTVVKYTHYRLEFPNDQISFTRSGNYIVKIHAPNNPDQLYIVARFMVLEPAAVIDGKVLPSRVVSDRDYRQEVNLEVNLSAIQVLSPYQDIEVVVLQNWRWDNKVSNIKPSFLKDQKLIYNYATELSFEGGNEFRFFDAKSLRYRSERVASIVMADSMYQLALAPDKSQAYRIYTFQNDLNGHFLIKNDDGFDQTHLESDYFNVQFNLVVDAPLGNGDLYVFGQLSLWQLNSNYRMIYDPELKAYRLNTALKQGYYNYQYIWRYAKQQQGSADRLEGGHSQTENEYHVFVYFKDPSAFSHRLVGYKVLSNFDK